MHHIVELCKSRERTVKTAMFRHLRRKGLWGISGPRDSHEICSFSLVVCCCFSSLSFFLFSLSLFVVVGCSLCCCDYCFLLCLVCWGLLSQYVLIVVAVIVVLVVLFLVLSFCGR